jgi:hypothetical protein
MCDVAEHRRHAWAAPDGRKVERSTLHVNGLGGKMAVMAVYGIACHKGGDSHHRLGRNASPW